MNTVNVGQAAPNVTGFVEFAEGELPPLLAQSGRAGARVSRDERSMCVNKEFVELFQSRFPQGRMLTLTELWEPLSYQQIAAAAIKCQDHGPQMIQGCQLLHDPWQKSFDLMLVDEPHRDSVLHILFETVNKTEQDELRRLRSIVNFAPVLISIKDRESVIRLTNQMFSILDGPQAEEYVNRSVFELFPRETAERLWKNDLTVFHTGQIIEAEETVRHRDGSDHTYLTYKFPLMQTSGEIIEVCAISTDITDRKYYEQQAFEAMRRAEEANRVKSDFLAHMSHEIRTPLTVIRGYAELIARKVGADATAICHWITRVMRASKQLELIVNDILDLSKVEAGIFETEKDPIDVRLLLQDLYQSFALRSQEKKLDFQVEISHEVPKFMVSDGLRLRQVLDNLVSNALKFTDQGSVRIVVDLAVSAKGPQLHIRVCDTGIGLSEEEQKKLFQPFVQADGSITRRYGGTGLGLVLARRLAQLLGGDVRIDRSAPQQGTDMLVIMPIGDMNQSPRPMAMPSVSCPDLDSSQKLCGRRLLIVEDAEDIRELLRYFLMQHGALMETACLGEEALARMEEQSFDGVLMDLQMPVLDGMQTMTAMRARGFRGVIVAVTAHTLQGEREKCLKAGFDEFLSKPIQLPQVLNLLEHLLATKRAAANPNNSHH